MGRRLGVGCGSRSAFFTIDGKVDGSALQNVVLPEEYEAPNRSSGGNAWICGRTTYKFRNNFGNNCAQKAYLLPLSSVGSA